MERYAMMAVLGAVISAAITNVANARTWTDLKGRTVEAEFLAYEHGNVRVKREHDGRLYVRPVTQFSDADQIYVWMQRITAAYDGRDASVIREARQPGVETVGRTIVAWQKGLDGVIRPRVRDMDVLLMIGRYAPIWRNDRIQNDESDMRVARIKLIPEKAIKQWSLTLSSTQSLPVSDLWAVAYIVNMHRLFPTEEAFSEEQSQLLLDRIAVLPPRAVRKVAKKIGCVKAEAALFLIDCDPFFPETGFDADAFAEALAAIDVGDGPSPGAPGAAPGRPSSRVPNDSGMTVKVAGLRIVDEPIDDDQSMRAFNWFAGTMSSLLVQRPEGGLIAVDSDATELKGVTDDLGTDLLAGEDDYGRNGFSSSGTFNEDDTAALIEINASHRPRAGAKSIRIAGTLAMMCASKKKTVTQSGVPLAEGAEIKLGDVTFTIEDIGKPDWGDAVVEFTIATSQDLDALSDVAFYDSDGDLIESRVIGTSSWSGLDGGESRQTLTLDKKSDPMRVDGTFWLDMKTVKVPLDLDVSVGF